MSTYCRAAGGEPSNSERIAAKHGREPVIPLDVAPQRGARVLSEPERRAGRLWVSGRSGGAAVRGQGGSRGCPRQGGREIEVG